MHTLTTHEFSALVREHHSSLRAYICSLGVTSAWVDDVAQEAFVLAFKKQEQFDPATDFGAWVRTIARNLVLNELSKQSRRRRLLDAHLPELIVELEGTRPAPNLDDRETSERARLALSACLQSLTERARGLVQARYFEEQSSEAIGEGFGMSAVAVRKALFSARKNLHRCLERKLKGVHA